VKIATDLFYRPNRPSGTAASWAPCVGSGRHCIRAIVDDGRQRCPPEAITAAARQRQSFAAAQRPGSEGADSRCRDVLRCGRWLLMESLDHLIRVSGS
jgi:hypothetical protein